jgi:hypothetical protein
MADLFPFFLMEFIRMFVRVSWSLGKEQGIEPPDVHDWCLWNCAQIALHGVITWIFLWYVGNITQFHRMPAPQNRITISTK